MRRPPESEKLYKLVGKRVGQHRKARGLSQTELANRCGLTRGSIANIELGNQRPTLHTLFTVAEALEIEPTLLLPAREELRAVVSPESAKTTKRVEAFTGENRDKVVSFIASTRQEARRDDLEGEGDRARRKQAAAKRRDQRGSNSGGARRRAPGNQG